jgi:hypothetical protein
VFRTPGGTEEALTSGWHLGGSPDAALVPYLSGKQTARCMKMCGEMLRCRLPGAVEREDRGRGGEWEVERIGELLEVSRLWQSVTKGESS